MSGEKSYLVFFDGFLVFFFGFFFGFLPLSE